MAWAGHAGGDVASKIVVSEVARLMLEGTSDLAYFEERIEDGLRQTVKIANKAIRTHVQTMPEYEGMGATVVALFVVENKLYWVSVGDSLLFLHRDGQLHRLNAEHSMAAYVDSMAAAGQITHAEAMGRTDRSVLTSALTGDRVPMVDCRAEPVTLAKGDIILVASDGLTTLDPSYVGETVTRFRQTGAQGIAHALGLAIDTLNEPGQDNVSIAVLEALDG